MRKRKRLSIFLAIAMIFCYIPGTAFADEAATGGVMFADMPNDWSTEALTNAVDNGLISGYEEADGSKLIKPTGKLTRAEMATIVNRAFGAAEKAALTGVADVSADAWYAGEIQKAVKMETFKLDSKMRPDDSITRQEAFTVLARAFKVSSDDSKALDAFADKGNVAAWAAEGISGLVKEGYVAGSGGMLNPTASITRAEFAKIMDNMVKVYITEAGTVKEVASGNVMINVPGVTLDGVTINGNLIIGDGVGDGDVTLNNVKVTGETVVRGGGINSILIKGNSDLGNIIVAKIDGNIRIFVDGGTEVEIIYIEDGIDNVIIEGPVGAIEIAADVSVVVQNAAVGEINITGEGASLTVGDGAKVEDVNIGANATGATVEAQKGATITNVETKGEDATIKGEGSVKNVEVNADGATISTPNTKVETAPGVEAPVVTNPPATGGSSGGSSGSKTVAVSAISVDGGAKVGETLTAKVTPDKATVNYQWQRADAENGTYEDISGATGKTYTLTDADQDMWIRVKAIGEGSYSGTVYSDSVGPVPVIKMIMSAEDIEVVVGSEFTMPVTVKSTGATIDSDDKVRFYGVIPGLTADDIDLAEITGGKPTTNIDEIERNYAGANEGDLVLAWGPEGGFSVGSLNYTEGVTTHFKATIKKLGVYTVTFVFYDLTTGEQLNAAGESATITVREPAKSEYGFEITGADQDFVAGELLESSNGIIASEDGVETTGLTPVNVTLRATDIKELGYEKVRVLPPEVTQTVGSGGKLQFWAYSADDGKWFDAAVTGWGSGFELTPNYGVTTLVYVFADTAGTYEVTFKLVEWSENAQVGEPITTVTATITVISQEMAAAINAAKNAIKPSWAVDSVEPVDDEALPSGVENVDYKVTIKTSYEDKTAAQASGRTVTTLFTIPDGVTVWYPVWEDGKLTYMSASSGEVALGMVGHPLNEENIDADGIVYVALGETTETKFTVTIKLIDADEDWQGVVYSEQELEIKVPEVSKYGFVIDDNIEIIAGGLLDGYVYESEDGENLDNLNVSDLTAVKVTLKATAEKDLGYKKVRILPLKVEGPANSNLQAWMYASENDKKWWDTAVTGWGTAGTGFKLDADEETEMDVYVFVDTPGNYTVTFKAVDTSDPENEIVIAEGTTTIFAPFHFDVDTGTISNYVGNEENITIPATINGVTVKAIGAGTFDGKASIKTVTFAEDSQLEAIGDNAFKQCQYLESIDLPSTVISIGNGAFSSCDLTEIDISNVKSIGAWAFGSCKFEEITIPGGCNVGVYAFGYCGQLNKIIVGSEVVLNENNALVYYFDDNQGTDRGFGDAYDGAGTYVLQGGTWTKQQP